MLSKPDRPLAIGRVRTRSQLEICNKLRGHGRNDRSLAPRPWTRLPADADEVKLADCRSDQRQISLVRLGNRDRTEAEAKLPGVATLAYIDRTHAVWEAPNAFRDSATVPQKQLFRLNLRS